MHAEDELCAVAWGGVRWCMGRVVGCLQARNRVDFAVYLWVGSCFMIVCHCALLPGLDEASN